tara:strand:- start:1046 stop:1360 length:315 start_codon:yes stop_codon:yes gene_type:complete
MANKIDSILLTRVYERYVSICETLGHAHEESMDFQMDIGCANDCHLLDLDKLLKFDDFGFISDVTGMMNNVDRSTPNEDLFGAIGSYNKTHIPRCAGISKLKED